MKNLRSMTGYGKGEYNDGVRIITAEIKTINNRYCDINIKIPKHFRPFEDVIRRILKNNIYRGRVDVYLNIEYIKGSDVDISSNLELARQYNDAINKIKDELGFKECISLETIIKFQDVLVIREKEDDKNKLKICVEKAVENAVSNLLSMRENEGKQLKIDVLSGLDKIKTCINNISKYSKNLVEDYKSKLEVRVSELLGTKYELDENRLYNEIVFYSDKCDINEEIIRLNSHMLQLSNTLNSDGPIGRKLDFILQEANREINTIGSKIGNLDITKNVIEVKNVLEKIREQVQNIE